MSDSTIKAIIASAGDPAVGIQGVDVVVDTGLIEFEDDDHREHARSELSSAYSSVHDDYCGATFSDECMDCGLVDGHADSCPQPEQPATESVSWVVGDDGELIDEQPASEERVCRWEVIDSNYRKMECKNRYTRTLTQTNGTLPRNGLCPHCGGRIVEATMDNQNRQLSGYGFLYGAIIAIAFLLITSIAEAQESWAKWDHPVDVEYRHDGSPMPESEAVSAIKYALWEWSERSGHQLNYAGHHNGVEKDKITITWENANHFADRVGNSMQGGYATFKRYIEGGDLSRAKVVLNSTITGQSFNRCKMSLLLHEIGHAMGITGHSDNQHDVMYKSPGLVCRESLSFDDLEYAGYGNNSCHTVLTRSGDLYVPMVDGHAASMRLTGEYEWKLDQWVESSGDCSTVSVSGSTAVLSEVRGQSSEYYAELEATGTDEWALWYAEETQ